MKMENLQNIQSFETCIESGNLQSDDEQSIDRVTVVWDDPVALATKVFIRSVVFSKEI